MIILALDTCLNACAGAVVRDGVVLSKIVEPMQRGHQERIAGMTAQLMADAHLNFPDLDRIAVTVGPGSFTGLRIGLSAARGIGLARDIAVVGVSSLVALSLTATGPATVLLDARRGEAYFQIFAGPGQPTTAGDLLPMAIAQAAIVPGTELISSPFVDIAALARFGARLDPRDNPPEPNYIRDADAKPQTAARIERRPT